MVSRSKSILCTSRPSNLIQVIEVIRFMTLIRKFNELPNRLPNRVFYHIIAISISKMVLFISQSFKNQQFLKTSTRKTNNYNENNLSRLWFRTSRFRPKNIFQKLNECSVKIAIALTSMSTSSMAMRKL